MGAPISEVIMPTGSSVGAIITRAKVSVAISRAAPNTAEAGSKKR